MIIPVGSGGLSKCSIIVHIDTGSTVGAYSNSAATTLVKTGKEIGTSGDYLITGLNTGTYYVKASKGGQSAISSAITFSNYGIKDVVLSYAFVIWQNGDGLADFNSKFSNAHGNPSVSLPSSGNIVATFPTQADAHTLLDSINSYNVSGVYNYLYIKAKASGGIRVGLATSRITNFDSFAAAYTFSYGTQFEEHLIAIPASASALYICMAGANNESIEIETIDFRR